jgi:hypothetical protein
MGTKKQGRTVRRNAPRNRHATAPIALLGYLRGCSDDATENGTTETR